MLGIKRLDIYILKKFLPLFAAAFFICLFVFMMQFTWRYLDELVGKGLTLEVLAQFFWYMGITLVPTSMPLAVLLATLITFGNMGDNLELLAMKAAGVSLMRIMRPLLIVIVLITGISFQFQNDTSPKAQVKMRSLLLGMKQTSPAIEIPEGVFYNNVPNMNVYVERKVPETGMLYQVILYKTDEGFENSQIVLADSGKMEITQDRLYLKVTLWDGILYQKPPFKGTAGMGDVKNPYLRQPFQQKQFLYNFDSNFSKADEEALRNMPSTKSMAKIETDVDSMQHLNDSLGTINYTSAKGRWYAQPFATKNDSTQLSAQLKTAQKGDFDKIAKSLSSEEMLKVKQSMKTSISSAALDWEGKSFLTEINNKLIRRHWVEWHQKMALSLACLLFFFIGAPLGAIIRKGGLGMPTVISVAIFIFYYIINTSSMKLARDGSWNMLSGMWLSTVVLIVLGAFFTYKANKDSNLFNGEYYNRFLRIAFGIRQKRNIHCKEVIIDDPDYGEMARCNTILKDACTEYIDKKRLASIPSYFRIFFHYTEDHRILDISTQMESMIEELSNSRDAVVLTCLNGMPSLFTHAHLIPVEHKPTRIALGVIFPIGIILWIRAWHFRIKLYRDLKQIIKYCDILDKRLEHINTQKEVDSPS